MDGTQHETWIGLAGRKGKLGIVSAGAACAAMAMTAAGCAKSGTGIGVVQQNGEPAGEVAFVWESGADSLEGDIATTLPTGESYQGRFLEMTSEYVAPFGDDYFYGWGPGYGYGWSYAGSDRVTEYSGVVIAALTSDEGNTMRCVFHLEDPASGLSGGGIGRCRTSEGTTIDNAIVGEGREVLTRRAEQRRRQTRPSG